MSNVDPPTASPLVPLNRGMSSGSYQDTNQNTEPLPLASSSIPPTIAENHTEIPAVEKYTAIPTSSNDSSKTPQEIPIDDGHKSTADLSKIDPKVLTTDPRIGLTEAELAERLAEFGLNEIIEHKPNALLKFLGYFTGPIAYLIEAACILSAALEDWTDFAIIAALLLVNALIGFMEEARAESAVDALKSTLALRCRVMRDGKMVEMEAKYIVPGDVISLRTGDVISADAIILPRVKKNQKWTGLHVSGGHIENPLDEVKHNEDDEDIDDAPVELSVDQSALTGESLPTNKFVNDLLYSSSIVKSGVAMALVVKTGDKTFVGRAANLIAITTDAGHFQKVIGKIGNFLVIITLLFIVVILFVGIFSQKRGVLITFQNALVICIASIPVGLPTVLSVTMAVGAQQLAAKKVIVKRLTAVEEMAGVDILCSDKTGTLTKNQLQLDEPYLTPNFTNVDLLRCGFLASEHATKDAIDLCLRTAACQQVPEFEGLKAEDPDTPGFHTLKHDPFTSTTKMATSTVRDEKTKDVIMVAKGAPQVILRLCKNDDHERATKAIIDMAKRGLRALGIARSKPFKGKPANISQLDWELIGCVSLLDPPREDSAETIKTCAEYGIDVKMVTGDTILIAKEVARRLGMDRCILSPAMLQDDHHKKIGEKQLIHMVTKADGFAQVVPEDKYRVVELLQNGAHLVGMTGDGVNDAPALKKANVGIAVHGCTDAARAAAAIVLLQPGLSTICDGIYTSRAIFERMRSYSLYRITSTIHFLIFLFSTIVAFDFTIPAILIVLICVMNDAATLVISVDNAQLSKRPDKWRIGQLVFLSTVLAVCLVASSYVHFALFRYVFFAEDSQRDDKVATALYLQLSSSPHFVIFSTRLSGPWYSNMPSMVFTIAILGTQVLATFFAAYGVVSTSIGWPASLAILAVSLVYFMFLDVVKIVVYQYWNYEFTVYLWPFFPSRWAILREKQKKIADYRKYQSRVRTMRVKVLWPIAFATWSKQKTIQVVTKKPDPEPFEVASPPPPTYAEVNEQKQETQTRDVASKKEIN